MTRIMKAWACSYPGHEGHDVLYAPDASKARYRAFRRWNDGGGFMLQRIRVRRHASSDMLLPVEHRLVAELSARDREIILHAYGYGSHISPDKWGYRDHYCCAPGNGQLLRLAWEMGLFRGPYGAQGYGETPNWSGAFFYLSELGQLVARSMIPEYGEAAQRTEAA